MPRMFSTNDVERAGRRQYWLSCLERTYYPLDIEFDTAAAFNGELARSELGELSFSLLKTDALRFRRLSHHVQSDREESFLLSLPDAAAVHFTQRGRSALCPPGSFVLEHSGAPYELSYGEPNSVHVLKIPAELLRRHVPAPERLCAVRFEAGTGAGALLCDYLRLLAPRLDDLAPAAGSAAARHLIELLALALEGAADPGDSEDATVRAAHLRRFEAYVRAHLADPALTPRTIAAACGVSVRYLHRIFQESERSVTGYIRELRLEGARDMLEKSPDQMPLAAIAYRWCFADQAHFCRAFKRRYGVSPGAARRRAVGV